MSKYASQFNGQNKFKVEGTNDYYQTSETGIYKIDPTEIQDDIRRGWDPAQVGTVKSSEVENIFKQVIDSGYNRYGYDKFVNQSGFGPAEVNWNDQSTKDYLGRAPIGSAPTRAEELKARPDLIAKDPTLSSSEAEARSVYLKSLNDPKSANYRNPAITSSNGMSPEALTRAIQQQNNPQAPAFTLTAGNLKVGSSGQDVMNLQKLLGGLTVDGKYGPKTQAAVIAFQKANGLTPDGIVGPKTMAALNAKFSQVNTGSPQGGGSTVPQGGNTGPIGTSTQARAQSKREELARIKEELEAGAEQPELYNSVEEFDRLRKEQGIVKDESELASIRNEARMAQEELRVFKSQNAKGITQGGFLGAVSEAERNMNFRLEGLDLREQAVVDRLNSKNSYINTVVNLGKEDYQTAKQSYDDEYSKNLQAIQIYNSELDDQKQDAFAGFQTMANLLSQSGLSQLTPELSQQMDTLALKAGLPAGVFQTALKGISANEQIKNTVKNGNNIYMQTVDADGVPHLKLIQTISDGGAGGGSGGLGGMFSAAQINSTINQIAGAFDNEPIVKNFNVLNEGYQFANSLSNTTKNPADDQGLIYAFAKAMDPGSVVREGEYATVQKYAQSLVNSYGKSVTQALAGTGFLSTEARANIKKTIEAKYQASLQNYNNVYKQYQLRLQQAQSGQGNSLTNYSQAYSQPSIQTNMSVAPTQEVPQQEQSFWSGITNWLFGD